MSIPLTHQIIHQTKLATVLAKAEKYDALWNSLTQKRYQGRRNMGNRLFGTAAAMVPQAGMSGVATIAPMVVAAVLENVNMININYDHVV